ncbi:hypothetical protein OSTOST_25455 [Ostertagia ostertagi]
MASAAANVMEWRQIVDRVITTWGGYQLGVDFNSGGPETLAKDEAMVQRDCYRIHVDHAWSESRRFGGMVEQCFVHRIHLILEDESVYPTSVFLLEALGYLRHNDRVHLERLMSTLPS